MPGPTKGRGRAGGGKAFVAVRLYHRDLQCMVRPMKHGHSIGVVWLCALAATVLTVGCSSSQMSRIDRNRSIYETWPLEVRQAVLDGKVEPGMDADMVRVSWGEPTQISATPAGDEIWIYAKGGDPGSVIYPGGSAGMGGSTIGMGGSGIGISTGRGGTSIGTSTGIGIGGGIGGVGIGGTGVGGMGGPIVTQPTPPDIREVVFRGGVVLRADKP